jgi:hypothetical protein
MTNIFKKTLLAAALSSVSAGTFAAADVTGSNQLALSLEGNPATVSVPVVQVVLGAEYAVGDVLTFTFSGGALDTATLATTVQPTLVDVNDTMTLGLLSSDENTAVYRVTELTYDGGAQETSVGAVVKLNGVDGVDALPGIGFTGPEVIANNGVTLSFSAVTNNNQSIDTTGANLSTQILFVGEELVESVATSADWIIDVEKDRKMF